MELSYFLAQFFGIFMIFKGVAILVRKNEMKSVISEVTESKAMMLFASIFGMALGLFVILNHNIWVSGWPVVVTIIGWGMFLYSAKNYIVPHSKGSDCLKRFGNSSFLVFASVINIILGVYLATVGFGGM